MVDSESAGNEADRPALLAQHPFFATLARDEIETVTRGLPCVTLPPATTFVREGEAGDCVYLILAGRVEIIKALGTADERSFGVRGPGDVIGEMSLIDPDERRSASVRTQSTVEALVITQQDFDALLLHYPRLSRQLLRTLSQRLRASESATIRDLQQKNSELNQAYLELKAAQQQIVEQEVLAHELAHAQRIQLQMLPTTLPHFERAEIGAAILAARSVGGDLYEVIPLGVDRLAVAIGDVAGKGIPAALYMALVSSLLRAEARQAISPAEVVRRINQHLCERDMESMFVTLLYCELDLRTRHLQIVRAGHEQPLLWSGQTPMPRAAAGRAMPLGLVDDPLLDVQEIILPAAATLLLFTDGVTDAIDPHAQPFGRDRLIDSATRNLHRAPQALCDAIVHAVLDHQGKMPQFDDVTLLAVHVD